MGRLCSEPPGKGAPGEGAVPEDADKQLQGELLDLVVEPLLPGPPAGSPLVHVGAGAQLGEVQVVVQLEALDPGGQGRVTCAPPGWGEGSRRPGLRAPITGVGGHDTHTPPTS